MKRKTWIAMAAMTISAMLSGCAPAVIGAAAVGAGGVIMADKALEDEKGGDGLF